MKKNTERNKKIIEGIIIYGIGIFGTKILSFLIVPLYTFYISTHDMGLYDILHSTVNLLVPIVTLQISDAAYRWIIRKERVEDSIRSTMQILFFNSIVVSGIILVVNCFYKIPYVYYFIGLLISSRVLQTVQKLLRGLQNQRLYAGSSILFTFIYLILNVVQICILKMGVVSLFQSAIISNIVVTCLIFIIEKRIRISLLNEFDFRHIKEMIGYSAPLVPNQLNWWIMGSSDRYIITMILGTSANGIYAIAAKFPSLLQLVMSLFNTSWQDMAVAEEEKDGVYYGKIFEKLYVFAFSFFPLLIAVTQIYIRFTMDHSYHDAAKYIAFLYLGTIFQCFSSFYGVGYLKDKNTKQASLTSIYGALVNIVLNFALIKLIGLHAASVSTFIGFFVMWFVRERQNKKKLQIKIDMKKFVSLFVVSIIIACISPVFNIWIDFVVIILGFVYFLLFNYSTILKMFLTIRKMIKRKN